MTSACPPLILGCVKAAQAPEALPRIVPIVGGRQSWFRRAASGHWITSSARSSTDGGIVTPSALAVLRLMISSNFVGSSTGKSAGLAPLRIRSTGRGASEHLADIGPVGHEPAGTGEVSE